MAYQPSWVYNAKAILEVVLLKTIACEEGDKGVYTFCYSVSPKLHTIARLKFDLAYDDIAV